MAALGPEDVMVPLLVKLVVLPLILTSKSEFVAITPVSITIEVGVINGPKEAVVLRFKVVVPAPADLENVSDEPPPMETAETVAAELSGMVRVRAPFIPLIVKKLPAAMVEFAPKVRPEADTDNPVEENVVFLPMVTVPPAVRPEPPLTVAVCAAPAASVPAVMAPFTI